MFIKTAYKQQDMYGVIVYTNNTGLFFTPSLITDQKATEVT